jgi:hypothetical protein
MLSDCSTGLAVGWLSAKRVRSWSNRQRLVWIGVFVWSSNLGTRGNIVVAKVRRRCGSPLWLAVAVEVGGWP